MPHQVTLAFVIFDRSGHSDTHKAQCQSAQMLKITNDDLTRSGTGCFIADPYGNSGHQKVKTINVKIMINFN